MTETRVDLKRIEELMEKSFLPQLNSIIKHHIDEKNKIQSIIQKTRESVKSTDQNSDYCVEVLERMRKYLRDINYNFPISYSNCFSDFNLKVSDIYGSFSEKSVFPQNSGHFEVIASDPFRVKVLKTVKKGVYEVQTFLTTLYAKALKKPFNDVEWKHTVPLREVSRYYFRYKLPATLLNTVEETYKWSLKTYYIFWQAFWNLADCNDQSEHDLSGVMSMINSKDFVNAFQQIEENAELIKKGIRKEITNITKSIFEQYNFSIQKAGTIELPGNKFSKKNIYKNLIQLDQEFKTLGEGWNNTFEGLISFWEATIEIALLEQHLRNSRHFLEATFKSRLDDEIKPVINSFRKFFLTLDKQIDTESSIYKIIDLLINNLENDFLKQKLSSFGHNNIQSGIIKLFDEFESKTFNIIGNIDQNFLLLKDFNHQKSSKIGSFFDINIGELITYKYSNNLWEKISVIKSNIITETQRFIEINNDLAKELITRLMSLKDEIDDTDPKSVNRVRKLINEAQEKSENASEKFLVSLISQTEFWDEALNNFFTNTGKFRDIKHIQELDAEYKKEKQFKQAENGKKGTIGSGQEEVYSFINKLKKSQGKNNTDTGTGSMSINKYQLQQLSTDLKLIGQNIKKLPNLYKHLYRLQPIKDDLHQYIRDEAKFLKFDQIYNLWQETRSGSVMIISERGIGTTSFINYYLNEKDIQQYTLTLDITYHLKSVQELYAVFSQCLNEKAATQSELVKLLTTLERKHCVVIDGIEKLYFRTEGGDKLVGELFDIIRQTERCIFWICAINEHAFKYMNVYLPMANITKYQLYYAFSDFEAFKTNLLNRHKISGYQLEFIKPTELPSLFDTRKYIQNPQKYLYNLFFDSLYHNSHGNLSVGQAFWLQAVKAIDNGVMKIDPYLPDFNIFMNQFDDEVKFILKDIVLHNGLNDNEIYSLNQHNIRSTQSVIEKLVQEHILMEENGVYKINLYIYLPVVKLLKDHHFLVN